MFLVPMIGKKNQYIIFCYFKKHRPADPHLIKTGNMQKALYQVYFKMIKS